MQSSRDGFYNGKCGHAFCKTQPHPLHFPENRHRSPASGHITEKEAAPLSAQPPLNLSNCRQNSYPREILKVFCNKYELAPGRTYAAFKDMPITLTPAPTET